MTNPESLTIRRSDVSDQEAVLKLYQKVAREPGGLARLEPEVDADYIAGFLAAGVERGLGLVALLDDALVGEIHAYAPGLFCFAHVLSDLTIAVDPDAQGAGVGRRLFSEFMQTVAEELQDIQRVELIARESNQRAIRFYESLGFEQEGVFRDRIRNLDGSLEADIPMAWMRPGSD